MKVLFILAFFTMTTVPITVRACSCSYSTPDSAFNDAQAVFIGTVLGSSDPFTSEDANKKNGRLESGLVRFSVDTPYKGSLKGRTDIRINNYIGTSCGPYGLVRNTRYVVYAYKFKDNPGVLYSGSCTRTNAVSSEYAEDDLKFLTTLPPPGTGGNLKGRLWYDSKTFGWGSAVPMPNVPVLVTDTGGKTISLTTDAEGEFSAFKLRPGKYTVTPKLPENFFLERPESVVTIADRGTAGLGFQAYYTGRVSGRVIDKNGTSYNHIWLHLYSTEADESGAKTGGKTVYADSTGTNGEFEFKGVPPGIYRIVLQLQHSDYEHKKHFYYPGTYDWNKAVSVRVGLGEKLDGLTFTLPPEYEVQTIDGRVVWANGRPAVGAEVNFGCPTGLASNGLAVEFGGKTVETDKQGRFHFELFVGETYWLSATGYRRLSADTSQGYYTPTEKIVVTKDLRNKRLILSDKNGYPQCP